MRSEWPPAETRPFWQGLGIALLLGGASWLAGCALTAFVVWWTERLG